jgi:hypothetical protein
MPANLQQVFDTLGELRSRIAVRAEEGARQEASAVALLGAAAADQERLRGAVAAAVDAAGQGLRCALPAHENIAMAYPAANPRVGGRLLAVDGSQTTPDRHQEILFALINVAVVSMSVGSGAAPDVYVDTRLLFGDSVYVDGGRLVTEGEIALERDVMERGSLLKQAGGEPGSALLDGPLELWGTKEVADRAAFKRALSRYLADLARLHELDWIVAGYVDKPGADLVVRLLELSQAGPKDLAALRSYHPLGLVSDRRLFAGLLPPGYRSAVFALQSESRSRYTGAAALHFFYLNVGSDRQPAVARVEVPEWVASDSQKMDMLHASLLDQCALLGFRPYPYILHRAHETARITPAEQESLKLRLLMELRTAGVQPEGVSGKSFAKTAGTAPGRF